MCRGVIFLNQSFSSETPRGGGYSAPFIPTRVPLISEWMQFFGGYFFSYLEGIWKMH